MDSNTSDMEDYALSDYSVEINGNELSGLETMSHMYGLAKREQQLEQLYDDLQGLCMRLNSGFRPESPRIESAWEDTVESYNQFFGKDYGPEELMTTAAQGVVEAGIKGGEDELRFWNELREQLAERNGMISYDEFRETVLGQE